MFAAAAAGVRCIIMSKAYFVFGDNLWEKNPFPEKLASLTRFLPKKSTSSFLSRDYRC